MQHVPSRLTLNPTSSPICPICIFMAFQLGIQGRDMTTQSVTFEKCCAVLIRTVPQSGSPLNNSSCLLLQYSTVPPCLLRRACARTGFQSPQPRWLRTHGDNKPSRPTQSCVHVSYAYILCTRGLYRYPCKLPDILPRNLLLLYSTLHRVRLHLYPLSARLRCTYEPDFRGHQPGPDGAALLLCPGTSYIAATPTSCKQICHIRQSCSLSNACPSNCRCSTHG